IRSGQPITANSGTNQEPVTEGKDGRSPLHRAAASPLQYRGNDAAVHPLRRNHYKFVMNSKKNFDRVPAIDRYAQITAAQWSGLQLVLYLVPDLRRHCAWQITNSAVEFFAALGVIQD